MDDLAIARGLHVLAVVLWIGGVGMVTTVLLPMLRQRTDVTERIALFEAIEGRFGWQARGSVIVAGLSGLYMLIRMDAWDRFLSASYWWMHAMVLVWLIFAVMLFVMEPLVVHRHFAAHARRDPDRTFRTLAWAHLALLTLSLITIFGVVASVHGLVLFD